VPNKIICRAENHHDAVDAASFRYTPVSAAAGNDSIADLECPCPSGDAMAGAHSVPRAIVERHRALPLGIGDTLWLGLLWLGLARRTGPGFCRMSSSPDTDLSCLPIVPPVEPACANDNDMLAKAAIEKLSAKTAGDMRHPITIPHSCCRRLRCSDAAHTTDHL
jgi:hypothetical protein